MASLRRPGNPSRRPGRGEDGQAQAPDHVLVSVCQTTRVGPAGKGALLPCLLWGPTGGLLRGAGLQVAAPGRAAASPRFSWPVALDAWSQCTGREGASHLPSLGASEHWAPSVAGRGDARDPNACTMSSDVALPDNPPPHHCRTPSARETRRRPSASTAGARRVDTRSPRAAGPLAARSLWHAVKVPVQKAAPKSCCDCIFVPRCDSGGWGVVVSSIDVHRVRCQLAGPD